MKKNKYLIIGFLFLILSVVIIYFTKINVVFFPTQEIELSGELEYGPLTKEFIIVQEITATKEYLTAVELVMVSSGVPYVDENTLMVMDTNYQPLYVHFFTNETMDKPQYQTFKFPEKIYVGKGKKVILCLSTFTGDKESHLAVPRIPTGKFGKLSVKPVVNGDVIGTLKASGQVSLLEGSLCLRTYETNFGFVNWFKICLFLLASLLTLLIIFAEKYQSFIVQLNFVPEKIYVVFALLFGLLLVFITPPLQAPDENYHLIRAYKIAELDIFQFDPTAPTSIVKLFDTFGRLNFGFLQKTNINEIIAQGDVKLNPSDRKGMGFQHYPFPYFPQALGIFIGKKLNGSPLSLLYIGRIFNLLFSVVLIYFAIRAAPFFKWIFLLLGLMPMTLFLSASLAKDGMVISFAFLLIALFLQFAFDQHKKIGKGDLVILLIFSFLVATTRPIYAMLIGMFFLIPVCKIGSQKKYIFVFICLISSVILANQFSSLGQFFKPKAIVTTQSNSAEMLSSGALSVSAPIPSENFERPDRPKIPKGINPDEQKRFILNNSVQYLGILFNSLFNSKKTAHLDSFVGKLGWLNKPLPKWHINFYLLMLIITTFLLYNNDIKIGWTNRLVILVMFTTMVILIETGQYIVWNPVGQTYIMDVHGRYFIPFAPLFPLLLYNSQIGKYLNTILISQKKNPDKIKKKVFTKPDSLFQDNRQVILYNSFYLLIVCFSAISLLSTVYVVLTGYYVVTI